LLVARFRGERGRHYDLQRDIRDAFFDRDRFGSPAQYFWSSPHANSGYTVEYALTSR
jgi:hypothetical protein